MPSRPTVRWTPAAAVACAAVVSMGLASPLRAGTATSTRPFTLRATTACLGRRHVAVGRVQATNRRMRALRDLDQKTSRQAKLRGFVIGIAFERSIADAKFLFELLQVPNDPLRLERVRNVVLLSPHRAAAERAAVVGCLRG